MPKIACRPRRTLFLPQTSHCVSFTFMLYRDCVICEYLASGKITILFIWVLQTSFCLDLNCDHLLCWYWCCYKNTFIWGLSCCCNSSAISSGLHFFKNCICFKHTWIYPLIFNIWNKNFPGGPVYISPPSNHNHHFWCKSYVDFSRFTYLLSQTTESPSAG